MAGTVIDYEELQRHLQPLFLRVQQLEQAVETLAKSVVELKEAQAEDRRELERVREIAEDAQNAAGEQ